MYEYFHQDDVALLAEAHKSVLQPPYRLTTADYKFRTKHRGYVRLQSDWKTFINPWTKEIEYLVAKNSLIMYAIMFVCDVFCIWSTHTIVLSEAGIRTSSDYHQDRQQPKRLALMRNAPRLTTCPPAISIFSTRAPTSASAAAAQISITVSMRSWQPAKRVNRSPTQRCSVAWNSHRQRILLRLRCQPLPRRRWSTAIRLPEASVTTPPPLAAIAVDQRNYKHIISSSNNIRTSQTTPNNNIWPRQKHSIDRTTTLWGRQCRWTLLHRRRC